jgi:hypothetical protein
VEREMNWRAPLPGLRFLVCNLVLSHIVEQGLSSTTCLIVAASYLFFLLKGIHVPFS